MFAEATKWWWWFGDDEIDENLNDVAICGLKCEHQEDVATYVEQEPMMVR